VDRDLWGAHPARVLVKPALSEVEGTSRRNKLFFKTRVSGFGYVALTKVRDREDALASTRHACAPQNGAPGGRALPIARILRTRRVRRADGRELRRRNAVSR
jgi:hypothetical protein